MNETLILRGWINVEHLKCGLPGEHFKTKEHRFLVIRSNPSKLLRHSIEPIFVKITIERENHAAKTFKFSKTHIHEEKNGFKNAKPASSYLGPKKKNKQTKTPFKDRTNQGRLRGIGKVNTYGL